MLSLYVTTISVDIPDFEGLMINGEGLLSNTSFNSASTNASNYSLELGSNEMQPSDDDETVSRLMQIEDVSSYADNLLDGW